MNAILCTTNECCSPKKLRFDCFKKKPEWGKLLRIWLNEFTYQEKKTTKEFNIFISHKIRWVFFYRVVPRYGEGDGDRTNWFSHGCSVSRVRVWIEGLGGEGQGWKRVRRTFMYLVWIELLMKCRVGRGGNLSQATNLVFGCISMVHYFRWLKKMLVRHKIFMIWATYDLYEWYKLLFF